MSIGPDELLHLACAFKRAHGRWPAKGAVSPATAAAFQAQSLSLFEPSRIVARRLRQGCVDWYVDDTLQGDAVTLA